MIGLHGQKIAGSGVKMGMSFGSCLAIVVSYSAWHSIPWAILHGIFSWGYIAYYAIKYIWLN
jgi:hypothetical protein